MSDVRGTVWSDWEVDAIVADYFSMLGDDLGGRPYSKAQHNEALQQLIPRTRKSIEFKHCNISAVLERLGIPYVGGYRPLAHFQNALIDSVERYLTAKGQPIFQFTEAVPGLVADTPTLWIGPPPEVTAKEQSEPNRLRQLVRKFDPAERDARNRKLGRRGEELVYLREQHELRAAGRDDLARKVEWTSEVRGDGAGYDIRSFDLGGGERLIEVKTTNGPAKTPFFLSENERAFSDEQPDAFKLLRLYSFIEKPSAFEMRPPLSERLALNPVNYRASLI
ncbi:DUF3883 domain-containing protein [Sphingomonas sp.]|uniref:DUF3883 domain-containing protein n=1 Tax=Sphingomonas sp. TaxID=28214 RepID=UPI00184B6172|nr:DUF3883 domain-containing protein [Sphingomonas sp.]MBA3510733.1 DUF3883 domain-containing protein [Sphingomonas sp.]